MGFLSFFAPRAEKRTADQLNDRLVAAARAPHLYTELAVPDTLSGRFDMVVLHAFLLMRRLKNEGPQAQAVSQHLFDTVFADMDDALRIMGVGDLVVGKRIRKMAEAFYGRVSAYDEALERADMAALELALRRNVWPQVDQDPYEPARALARYVQEADTLLKEQPLDALLAGEAVFAHADPARQTRPA